MSENPNESALRSLPAVGKLSEHGDLSEHLAQYGQPALVAAARKTIDQARQQNSDPHRQQQHRQDRIRYHDLGA